MWYYAMDLLGPSFRYMVHPDLLSLVALDLSDILVGI